MADRAGFVYFFPEFQVSNHYNVVSGERCCWPDPRQKSLSMADDTQKRSNSSPTDEAQYAATRLFEPVESLSRQEKDIAFAAELLQSGLVNERETSAAVSDWSIHGTVSLAQHLESKNLLTAEQIGMLDRDRNRRFETNHGRASRPWSC
jgi:hypothetical protein